MWLCLQRFKEFVPAPIPDLVRFPAFPFAKKRSLSHRIYENKGLAGEFTLDLTKRET
jgi:hypothetical protein